MLQRAVVVLLWRVLALVCVALALVGVAIVLGHGNPLGLFAGHVGIGEVALFGCVLSWATYTLVGKRVLAGLSPLVATTYAALVGTALLALACAISGDLAFPPADAKVWIALGFLGVFGTAVGFVWFYDGVVAIGPARTAVFINLVPVFAIVFGVLLLGERVEAAMLAGGAIVIAGIWIINRPQAGPVAVAAAH